MEAKAVLHGINVRAAVNQWYIRKVRITRIVDMEVNWSGPTLLPQATAEAVLDIDWLASHFIDEDGNLIVSVLALVIETPALKIIVDTCVSNDKQRSNPVLSNLQLPFLEDRKSAGYDRRDIDIVLCTHLHMAQVGWSTMLVDGYWRPTFPNARYLFGKEEFEFWTAESTTMPSFNERVLEEPIRPVLEAGLVDLVDITIGYVMKCTLNPLRDILQILSVFTLNHLEKRHSSRAIAYTTPAKSKELTGPVQLTPTARQRRMPGFP